MLKRFAKSGLFLQLICTLFALLPACKSRLLTKDENQTKGPQQIKNYQYEARYKEEKNKLTGFIISDTITSIWSICIRLQ